MFNEQMNIVYIMKAVSAVVTDFLDPFKPIKQQQDPRKPENRYVLALKI